MKRYKHKREDLFTSLANGIGVQAWTRDLIQEFASRKALESMEIDAAIQEYQARGGVIRKVTTQSIPVKGQVLNTKQQPKTPVGYREIDLVEVL